MNLIVVGSLEKFKVFNYSFLLFYFVLGFQTSQIENLNHSKCYDSMWPLFFVFVRCTHVDLDS